MKFTLAVLVICGLVASFAIGLQINHRMQADPTYKPSVYVIEAMHQGFFCHAEFHPEWQHRQYEWICRKDVK